MGNEMGNSNTSGLQEEENSTTQVEEKSVKEAGHTNGAQVENHIIPVAEGIDYQEKENGLASGVPNGIADPQVANQISNGQEEEGTEVHSSTKSPKVEMKSNSRAGGESREILPNSLSNDLKDHKKPLGNADGVEGENHIVPVAEDNGLRSNIPKEAEDPHIVNQVSHEREHENAVVNSSGESSISEVESSDALTETNDIQPTSPSKYSEDAEIPQDSTLEENLQQITDHQQKNSIDEEEEGTKNTTSETTSSSHDPEPQEFEDSKFDQPELGNTHADPSIQDSNRSSQIIQDPLLSNLNCTREENDHPVDTKILKDVAETIVSCSMEMEMNKDNFTRKETASEAVSCVKRRETKHGDEIVNNLGEKPTITSDFLNGVSIKCNGELSTEMSPVTPDSPKVKLEVTPMDKSVNPQPEVSESTDNFVVNGAETILMEEESEYVEEKTNDCPTHSSEESDKESKADGTNLSQSEFLTTESQGKNDQSRLADVTCNSSEGKKGCIEEAKIVENGHLVDEHIDDPNEPSKERSKDSPKEAEMVPESGICSRESSLTDYKREVVPEERKIIRETEEKTKASYGVANNAEGRENGEPCASPVLPVEQEVSLPRAPVSLVQPQDNQQINEMLSEKIQSSSGSISELKQENNGDIFVSEGSCFFSKNLVAETSVSVTELAIEKAAQDLSQHTERTRMAAAESDTQVNHANEQCRKVEMPAFASDCYQAEETAERFSTESNPNNSNAQAQMQKSPSFGLDLRIEARTEDSDRTPLLYQDKTATEDFSSVAEVNLGNLIADAQHGENKLQYHAMPVEEKVVRMEKSDSGKSRTPFLGFLKQEEEAHIIVTAQKNDHNISSTKKANKESLSLQAKEVASTSPKSTEKRKHRPSLFTNCMCCATVIN